MHVARVTSRIGASITGIDLSRPLDDADITAIRDALQAYGVIFFPAQPILTAEAHRDLAAQFGEISISPKLTRETVLPEVLVIEFSDPAGGGTDIWHSDLSYLEKPPLGSILQAQVLPEVGGDTCFASMNAAYEALSPAMQSLLEGLTARHSTAASLQKTRERGHYSNDSAVDLAAPRSQPIVTADPLSGQRRLFVNPNYTVSVDGMSKAEGDHLLAFLYAHIKSPEFQMRYRWSVGDIAFWDNHAVQHYAVADYSTRRVMQRVTLAGYKPIAADDARIARAA